MQKIELKGKTVLVTGAAGFIGSNLVIELFKTIENIKIIADTSALERDYGFKPSTSLRDGLRNFAEWYKEFYKV